MLLLREELRCEIGMSYAITLGWRITFHGLLGDFGVLAYTDIISLLHTRLLSELVLFVNCPEHMISGGLIGVWKAAGASLVR